VAEAGRDEAVEEVVADTVELEPVVLVLVDVDVVPNADGGNPENGTTAEESIQLVSPRMLERE
jgi:hypothetical protein